MRDAVGAGAFAAMRIPISSNRTGSGHWIAGLSPSEPERWCDYLRSVHSFWADSGWLAHAVPLLYAQDEPSLDGSVSSLASRRRCTNAGPVRAR